MELNLGLDLTKIFCDCDDFCQLFERLWTDHPQLTHIPQVFTKNWDIFKVRQGKGFRNWAKIT